VLTFLIQFALISVCSNDQEIHFLRDQANTNSMQDPLQPEARNPMSSKETRVASAPLLFAPHHVPRPQTNSDPHHHQYTNNPPTHQPIISRWNSPLSSNNLRRPANSPHDAQQTFLNQDDARLLEQYLFQYPRYTETMDQKPLDLAHMNDRALVSKPLLATDQSNPERPSYGSEQQQSKSMPAIATAQQRSDRLQMLPLDQQQVIPASSNSKSQNNNALLPAQRRGRVDDVVVFNRESKSNGLKNLIHKHIGNTLPPGCISRAAPSTSSCEDHLIRRLNQDATEGRTVIDVSRRLCCALFWHKDCISQAVIQYCPDSNPVAAELLLGSRNLDLTMSCQRFNRDGCNGSQRQNVPESFLMSWMLVLMATLLIMRVHN
jgi:hypothetical protein